MRGRFENKDTSHFFPEHQSFQIEWKDLSQERKSKGQTK